jgi:hypothetical protein
VNWLEQLEATDKEAARHVRNSIMRGRLSLDTLHEKIDAAYLAGVQAARDESVETCGQTALKAAVWTNLNNAEDNNGPKYTQAKEDPREIANSLTAYAVDMEQYCDCEDELVPHIESWQEMQKEKNDGNT